MANAGHPVTHRDLAELRDNLQTALDALQDGFLFLLSQDEPARTSAALTLLGQRKGVLAEAERATAEAARPSVEELAYRAGPDSVARGESVEELLARVTIPEP